MLFSLRYAVTILATCERALSCWRMVLGWRCILCLVKSSVKLSPSLQFKCECECAFKLQNHTFCCQTSAVSVIYKLQKHNTRLFTQTVSQPRHREHCGFLHFIQKVLNFILLEMMFYPTIMDFKIFGPKVW